MAHNGRVDTLPLQFGFGTPKPFVGKPFGFATGRTYVRDELGRFAPVYGSGETEAAVAAAESGQSAIVYPKTSEISRRMAEGGFTYDMDEGEFPTEGYAVGKPGFSRIITPEAFSDPVQGKAFLKSYIDDTIADRKEGERTVIGGWHDTKHNEFTFDRVDIIADLEEAKALGAERGEQAIYDLSKTDGSGEIPTGGTGGRENITVEGLGTLRYANGALQSSDLRLENHART